MAVAVFMASQHGEPAILVPNANELTYLSNGQRMLLEDARLGTPTFLLSSAGRPVLLQLRPCGRLVDTGPRGSVELRALFLCVWHRVLLVPMNGFCWPAIPPFEPLNSFGKRQPMSPNIFDRLSEA